MRVLALLCPLQLVIDQPKILRFVRYSYSLAKQNDHFLYLELATARIVELQGKKREDFEKLRNSIQEF